MSRDSTTEADGPIPSPEAQHRSPLTGAAQAPRNPGRREETTGHPLLLALVLAALLVALVALATTIGDRADHRPVDLHRFVTRDGTTVEWIGDTCAVGTQGDGSPVLMCTQIA